MTSAPVQSKEEIMTWLDSNRSYDAGIKLYFKYGDDPLLLMLFKETYSDFKLQKLHQVLGDMINPPLRKTSEIKSPVSSEPAKTVLGDDALKIISEMNEKVVEVRDELYDTASKVEDIEDHYYSLESQVDGLHEQLEKGNIHYKELEKKVDQLKTSPKFIPRGWPKEMDETVKALYDQWLPLFNEKKNLQARIYDIALAGQQDPTKKTEAGAMAHRILNLRDEIRVIYKKREHYLQHNKLPEEKKPIDIPEDRNKWPLTLQNWQRYVREYKNKLKKKPDNDDFKKQLSKYEWGVAELKKLMGI